MALTVGSLQVEILRNKSLLATKWLIAVASLLICFLLSYIEVAYAQMPDPPEPSVVNVTLKRGGAPEPPEPSVVNVTLKRGVVPEPPEPSVVNVTLKRGGAPEPPEPSVVDVTLEREKAKDASDQYGIDSEPLFKIPDVQGSMAEYQGLSVDPPRLTLAVGKASQPFKALVVREGGATVDVTEKARWYPGPDNYFTCLKAGKFTVSAEFEGASGSATVNCEEDRSVPAFEPPITSSTDRGAKLPRAAPADYTWYAICDPRSGEVTYGQQLPTGRKLMAGPFPGPRTVNDWIQKNCPRWRCDTSGLCATAPVLGGEWKVLCGKNDLKIYLSKTYDVTKFILVREGFLGEPDARAWASQNYPNWACTQTGAPVTQSVGTAPRMGGRWAVVCNRHHGGVGLTEYPDPTRDWIWGQGFFGEPDARLWTEQNCPSWRCDANGQCLKGVGRRTPEGTPPEVPSDTDSLLGEHWDSSQNHPRQQYLSDAEVKAFQDEIWNKYYEKWKREWCVTREEKKINAGKPGRVNYSGCAIEPHAKLGGLVGSAGRARTREQQNVVRSLAACQDGCMMNDTTPQVRESCLQNCIKTHPMPK